MSEMVHCVVLDRQAEALETAPWPGELGQRILREVSREGWQQWLARQTMLINEKHLNMMDKDARKYLNEQRDKFLSGEKVDRAEGFIPQNGG